MEHERILIYFFTESLKQEENGAEGLMETTKQQHRDFEPVDKNMKKESKDAECVYVAVI